MFPRSGCFWAKAYWLLCHSEVNLICHLDCSNSRKVFQTKPFFHGRNHSTNKTNLPRTKPFFHGQNHSSTDKTILPRTKPFFHERNHSSTDENIPQTKPFFHGRNHSTEKTILQRTKRTDKGEVVNVHASEICFFSFSMIYLLYSKYWKLECLCNYKCAGCFMLDAV